MSISTNSRTIESLLEQGEWEEARKLIKREIEKEPDNHWLLTQLGVTFYEQGEYRESVRWFLASLEIVPDCPLTLWNLAGALDAIGKPRIAIRIYSWLLRSTKTAKDDPCWESEEWTEALKADCVYRLGVCFQHMKRRESAERCFREYLDLLLAGVNGIYSLEDVACQIREVQTNGKRKLEKKVRDAINATVRGAGIQSVQGDRKLPRLSEKELLAT